LELDAAGTRPLRKSVGQDILPYNHDISGWRCDLLAGIKDPMAIPPGGRGNDAMSTPLDGIRVIDFGQYLAAPLVALLFADNGADVIKINNLRPDRNPHGSRAHTYVNHGKRTVLLVTAAGDGEERGRYQHEGGLDDRRSPAAAGRTADAGTLSGLPGNRRACRGTGVGPAVDA
jgi:hypothetical protein